MVVGRVRIGVQIAQHRAPWAALRAAAIEAEQLGIDAIFNWGHFFGPGHDSRADHLECWTMLAAWAETTDRITLGPLVSAIGHRNPDLLADMARTVDQISNGRVVLGLGAGFKQRDYDEYGYPFPSIGQRIPDLERGIRRIHTRLDQLHPAPAGPLPLLIGGSGEQRMLRIVARHADIWHTFADGDAFTHKSNLLDTYCDEIGRDPSKIQRSVLVSGEPDGSSDRMREAGATLFVVRLDGRPVIDLQPTRAWTRWRDQNNEP